MAEKYPIGVSRIFHRATGFKESVDVKMEILLPNGEWETNISFNEDGKGLYHVDYDFLFTGTYAALIYENGKKVTSQNFYITQQNSVIVLNNLKNKGSSVINNH